MVPFYINDEDGQLVVGKAKVGEGVMILQGWEFYLAFCWFREL